MTDHHLYLQGKPADDFVEVHEHVSPIKSYINVFAALLVLTAVTYAVSYMDLGPASLAVAMIVAFAKATLVCMYFMHLKYDEPYHVFVFLSTVLFVAIFFVITIFDLTSRDALNEEQETFFQQDYDPAASVRPPEYKVSEHGHGEGSAAAPEAGAAPHGAHAPEAGKDDAPAKAPAGH
jgi:cytochrome c oxidase subunit 4